MLFADPRSKARCAVRLRSVFSERSFFFLFFLRSVQLTSFIRCFVHTTRRVDSACASESLKADIYGDLWPRLLRTTQTSTVQSTAGFHVSKSPVVPMYKA